MTLSRRVFRPQRERPVPPASFPGTWPEYVAYRELRRQGYMPDVDFDFQSSQGGGRVQLGGIVVDFVFTRPPWLAIGINGVYYHYHFNGGEQRGVDIIKRGQMASLGYRLIFIDDVDLLKDPKYYISQALEFRDHSELGL